MIATIAVYPQARIGDNIMTIARRLRGVAGGARNALGRAARGIAGAALGAARGVRNFLRARNYQR